MGVTYGKTAAAIDTHDGGRARVPKRSQQVCAALLVALGALACRDSPTGPSAAGDGPPLAQIGESAHYQFRAAAGDTVDIAWQEQYHAWVTAALDTPAKRHIVYNKYTSRAHMQSVVGVGNTNAYAERTTYAIHTLWPRDNHEVVHLLTSGWGDPVALVNEGVAVAFQIDPTRDLTPRWSGAALHDLARQFEQQGRLMPMARVLETAMWRAEDPNVIYPVSGSFMRWLIDARGLAAVRRLYARAAGPSEPGAGVRAAFTEVFGESIEMLEAAWLEKLRG